MDNSKRNIKTISTVVIAILVLLICFILINGVYSVASGLRLINGSVLIVDNRITFGYWFFMPLLRAIALGFLAFMFLTMRKTQNPFTLQTVKQLKVLAVILPLGLFLHGWIHDFLLVFTGEQPFFESTLINFTVLILITGAAIYSLALIIQYGILLREDNEEII
ncbi:MAG: hypothetical protein FWE41_05600 [Coriobacteriia bacterium]|nr:hypothetical protein [Coriobacteriia bacterium]MCL2749434.1 hypothetical protein [Coriobacteriia bacterium]